MKLLPSISIFILTLFAASVSFSDWVKIDETVDGTNLFFDNQNIRKHDGYFYFWSLLSDNKPLNENGDYSAQTYFQADCTLFRFKILNIMYFNEPMGRGKLTDNDLSPSKNWQYPRPKSIIDSLIKSVCNM